ncbi:MAG: hypothetical protein INR66_23295, partial [Gordonia polyisoprenivorans]|nr:hypothetical protein [Gordonia polyisoprenivorans]
MTWQPAVGEQVVIFAGSDRAATGRVVEDFGDFVGHSVDVGSTHIADPARRWAVATDDGSLHFVDSVDLSAPSAHQR